MSGAVGVKAVREIVCCSGSWLRREALGADCVANPSAMANSGQVAKSSSGKRERPCSSDVFTRMKRTKKIFPDPIDRFSFRSNVRSDARPKRNQSRHKMAPS
eukprot:jgi/Phyca11/127519/e_gw1.70.36.1